MSEHRKDDLISELRTQKLSGSSPEPHWEKAEALLHEALRVLVAAEEAGEASAADIIHSDREIMGGTPVFVATPVPLVTLLDYLEAGQPLSELLEDFPTVAREQAVAALEQAMEALLARARPA